jgi:hypothetical protein
MNLLNRHGKRTCLVSSIGILPLFFPDTGEKYGKNSPGALDKGGNLVYSNGL